MVRLGDYVLRRPAQLSGGQRQRVALARAIVAKPKVLLLDEPLGALDLKLRESMQEELKSLQRSLGITFVFVTHDQGEALSMADRIAVFSQGRIEQIGIPSEIYERPANCFVADFVGSSNVLPPEMVARLVGVRRWASLRPEAIRVAAASGDEPGLVGRLMTRSYLGASTRLGFDLEGLHVHVVRPASEQLPTGERMVLRFAPEALHLLEPES
jgi:putative spermidine/putrescine transport system ATP-binding protein